MCQNKGYKNQSKVRKISLYIPLIILLMKLNLAVDKEGDWEVLNSPVQDDIHDVFFLNDRIGWAYTYGTGIIIKTEDEGKKWDIAAKLDPAYYEQIQFMDSRIGWLCGERGQVYKTEDGGDTWENLGLSDRKSQYYFYAMYFFDAETGFVGGMRKDLDGKTEFVLLKTEDGGVTWRKIKKYPNVFLTTIFFITERIGFASGQYHIYKTTNRGESWTEVYKGPPEGRREGFRGMYFLDEKLGFAVNAGGEVLRTHDGGKTWIAKRITNTRLRSIVFVNENEGYAVGDKNEEEQCLFHSTDSGITWLAEKGNYADLHRVKSSPNFIWAVGKEGTLLKKRIH
jgi:photosystem II stability/assembly factor-like uncharacterized protein